MPWKERQLKHCENQHSRAVWDMRVSSVSVLCTEQGGFQCPTCVTLAFDLGCGWCQNQGRCTTKKQCVKVLNDIFRLFLPVIIVSTYPCKGSHFCYQPKQLSKQRTKFCISRHLLCIPHCASSYHKQATTNKQTRNPIQLRKQWKKLVESD